MPLARCALLLALAASSCRLGGPTAPTGTTGRTSGAIPTATPVGTTAGPTVTATIGAAGGEVSSASGAVKISVPAGAVPEGTGFSITPLTNRAPGGVAPAFRIEASRALAAPVRLTLRGADSYPSRAGLGNLGVRFQDASGFWVAAGDVARDAGANTLTVTTSHLSDWAVVFEQNAPSLEGTFTLVQFVGTQFTASGRAALYRVPDVADPTYVVTGTISIPPELRSGTKICVPDVPLQTLALSVAEIVNARFRWGLAAQWGLTCTDTATGASFSELLATRFDTLGIALFRCTGNYTGTQVAGADFVQGGYAADCGSDGTVSASWDFRSCWAGGTCLSSDPCRTGVVTCTDGVASCSPGGNAANGTTCGTDQVCSNGVCAACVPGAACTPADPCHQGTTSCANGPECLDTGQPVADGTACGLDAVCGGGSCNACQPGAPCASQNACRTAALTCNTGFPVCSDTGLAANGTTCGTNLVCADGACVSCAEGSACAPANPCHAGTLSCSAGPSCVDTGTALADGTACGPDAVCGGGTCNACVAGASCPPPSGNPCHAAVITCNTGAPVCTENANAPDGTSCGAGQVCAGGACVACAAGASCTPQNPCVAGTLSCSAGPVCEATATLVAPGTSCGAGQVCDGSGGCVACVEGATCTPSEPCKVGAIACGSGAPVCAVTGDAPNGTACGAGQVCSAGACVSCVAGASCTPPNPCLEGTLSCSAGPACQASATPIAAGAACGPGQVCDGAGTCVACPAGEACTPSTPCTVGAIACDTGAPLCAATGPSPEGAACGEGLACDAAGACVCAPGTPCTPSDPCFTAGVVDCATGAPVCTPTTPLCVAPAQCVAGACQ